METHLNARSHGLWELTAPPPPPSAPLHGAIRADVTVIGGGFTGLSAALHLAGGGADAVVLEAREIGFGAAGRNVGLVNAGLWLEPDIAAARLGPRYGERLLDLLGHAPHDVFDLIARHGIDCEAEHTGTLHCAADDAGMREIERRAAQWQRRGAPVVLLGATQAAAKTGSEIYGGALLDNRAGTIQPLAYVRGLAATAAATGARIFTQSAAMNAERRNGRWIMRTPSGEVSSDWVIVATDAYATGQWSALRREQVLLPYFNLATAPLPDGIRPSILPERQGAWDTKKILSSFRLDRSGRLIFGSVGALRGPGTTAHRAWATRALRRIFPQIGGIAFETAWYGMIGMTEDALPRFHKLDKNVIAFSGYNGRGIAPGTVFGKVLASHILGDLPEQALPLPPSPVAPARFGCLRESFYELGSIAAHLFRAGP